MTTERFVTLEEVGHTSVSNKGGGVVQTKDGLVIGRLHRAKFPLGGYMYHPSTSDGRQLGGVSSAGSAMRLLVEDWNKRLEKGVASFLGI